MTAFNGQSYSYGDAGPLHAVDRIDGADRFDYDANGNMVKRNKGLTDQQTLVWNDENRLLQVQDSQGDLLEQYWYDVDGARVKKVSGTTTTYTFFAHYEEEVTGGVTTVVSYYSFGGLRIAVKRDNTLNHLHGDHLGSTSLTTRGSAETANRAYYAYGAERSASGDLKTDHTFTGQKRDSTGLMYYNARYYDPALGTFVSPDSMVPGAGQVINYNRFLYARGNPLKYSDPSGYASDSGGADAGKCSTRECWEEEWYWNNRWSRAHGYAFGAGHWDIPIAAHFADPEILLDVLDKAGIMVDSSWDLSTFAEFRNLSLLGQGVVAFAQKTGGLINAGTTAGLVQLKTLTSNGVTWFRAASGADIGYCSDAAACTLTWDDGRPAAIYFFDSTFKYRLFRGRSWARSVAVHELAHAIYRSCRVDCDLILAEAELYRTEIITSKSWFGLVTREHTRIISAYGQKKVLEYWAEAVEAWVYGSNYDGQDYMTEIHDWIEGYLRP